VTAGFSEPTTWINTATFTLTGPNGPVPAAITYD
jgi:hypothetical protein